MGAEAKNGGAAPAANGQSNTAGGEFSPEFMQGVLKRHGVKPPEAAAKKPAAPAKSESSQTSEVKPKPAEASGDEPTAEERARAEAAAREDGEEKPAGAEGEAPAAKESEAGPTEEEKAAAAEAEAARLAAEAAAEGGTEQELKAETEQMVEAKLKDLPEAQRATVQAIIDSRIGEIRRKSSAETDRLGSRVVELTQELEMVKKSQGAPIVVPGVHPVMLADSPEQIDRRLEEIEAFEDWAEDHKENGYEGDASRGEPSYTPEQIRARLRELRREKDRVIPQARTHLQERTNQEAQLKALLPAFYDPKTEEYRQAESVLKSIPELRRFPDSPKLVAQLVLGRKALEEMAKKAAAVKNGKRLTKPGESPNKPPAKPPIRAPRAPGGGSPGRGSVLDQPGTATDATTEVNNFTKTRSRHDLKKAVSALVFR